MKYALVFALLTCACGLVGATAIEPTNGWSLVFAYPAITFALLSVAYARSEPKLLGKRYDGRRRWVSRLLFAPYLLLTRFSFLMYKFTKRHVAVCEVLPGLLLGRRLNGVEAKSFIGLAVLDLASEFTETRAFRTGEHYLSLPVLDATPPTADQFTQAVGWIAEQLPHRTVLVHCALGHGRSASLVIAYLLHSGSVASVRDGLRLVRGLRPGVGLSPPQRRALEAWHAARIPPART